MVCRQLGYLTIGETLICSTCLNVTVFCCVDVIAHSFATLGGGPRGPHLSNVHCMGNESELVDCSHQIDHDCGQSEDAGVTCEGKINRVSIKKCRLEIKQCE